MSELINNRKNKLDKLKQLLKKIDSVDDVAEIKAQISDKLKTVVYEDVLAVEQELIAEGMPAEKMLELCDLHSNALHGIINENIKKVPSGHPVDSFRKENLAINREIEILTFLFEEIKIINTEEIKSIMLKVKTSFNNLMDIEKHYSRKENLLFPFLEKYQITGPSTVMWGKDDQVRKLLKEVVSEIKFLKEEKSDIENFILIKVQPTLNAIKEMIQKEEEILFPMSLDTLTELDWYDIYKQSLEIGYCLVAPTVEWKPESQSVHYEDDNFLKNRIALPSGNFNLEELKTIMNTLPFDLTFVDKDDYVRFFTEGSERIFQRNRAIIGRKVQFCHPPSSVAIVEQILDDFKSGRQDKAAFWINLHGQFIHIAYYALRNDNQEYIGTLEVSQNLTELRSLEGERRILSYDSKKKEEIISNHEEIIKIKYDAREDLANGVHPANKVISELETLKENEKYLLITPFPPMPLILKAKEKGFKAEQKVVSQAEHHTIFFK